MCKEDIVVEKEELIMKKDMNNMEIMREKNMKRNKKYSKVRNWIKKRANEVNYDLKLNVDEQQDDIKHVIE